MDEVSRRDFYLYDYIHFKTVYEIFYSSETTMTNISRNNRNDKGWVVQGEVS